MGVAHDRIGDLAPRFAEITDDLLYGEVWNDTSLSSRDHSLITVAKALDNGLTTTELASAISHLAFYAGWPAAMTAMTQLKRLAEQPSP